MDMNQDKALYRWVKASEKFPDDWESKHWRYTEDHFKLDTDLFEHKDGMLCKKGGFRNCGLPYDIIEWLEKVEADQQEDNDWLLQCKLKEEYMKKYSEALKEVERLRGILKEADDYLSEPIYEKGKPVYYNNIGAGSILHNKFKPITQ